MNKTTNETVQSMQHLDSLKAVKVAMDMNKAQDKTIDKLIDLVASMDKNMKLLAVKVLELEKICARYQMTVGADEKRKDVSILKNIYKDKVKIKDKAGQPTGTHIIIKR